MKASTYVILVGVLGSLFSSAVLADDPATSMDRGDRINQRLDNRGDRINNRLDSRGDRINDRLDRRGDRINDRLDRRSDRAAANAHAAPLD